MRRDTDDRNGRNANGGPVNTARGTDARREVRQPYSVAFTRAWGDRTVKHYLDPRRIKPGGSSRLRGEPWLSGASGASLEWNAAVFV
jgi:hypothetical protein